MARFCARVKVRLATKILLQPLPRKCRAANSAISPAPINITVLPVKSSKIRLANSTAQDEILTDCLPMAVSLRARLAAAKVDWYSLCKICPAVPADRACS